MVRETTGQSKGRSLRNPRTWLQRSSAEAASDQAGQLPESVYRSILGTERSLRRKPAEYNIGEVLLAPTSGFDPEIYEGKNLVNLHDAQSTDSVTLGIPYIAHGRISFTEEGLAVLKTPTGPINLGGLGSDAQKSLIELGDRRIVMPVVIDEITDKEMKGRAGEKALYLIPNPDWWTRGRLGKIGGQADIEGLVEEIDFHDKDRIIIKTRDGERRRDRRSAKIVLGATEPYFDQGTEEIPTKGVQVELDDRVRVPVEFVGRSMLLRDNLSLIDFSPEHGKSYNAVRESVSRGLDLFASLFAEDAPEKIKSPNGKRFDVSTPEKKAAVMRYLFAELRLRENSLTPRQQEQLWEYVFAMEPDERPFIFNESGSNGEPDPRRAILDTYFRETDSPSEMPKLSEAMTPKQLLQQLIKIAASDDYPPKLDDIIGVISDHQDRFGQDAAATLIHTVLASREEQLRTGSNPNVAIYSLLELLPHLKKQNPVYQTEMLAHLVHAGLSVFTMDQNTWESSTELRELMQQSIKGLGSAVFTDEEYYGVNYDALFSLLPFLDYLRKWPEALPFELGQDETFLYILRDLELMHAAKVDHDKTSELVHVIDGLQKL